jgi:hypothetical protein
MDILIRSARVPDGQPQLDIGIRDLFMAFPPNLVCESAPDLMDWVQDIDALFPPNPMGTACATARR